MVDCGGQCAAGYHFRRCVVLKEVKVLEDKKSCDQTLWEELELDGIDFSEVDAMLSEVRADHEQRQERMNEAASAEKSKKNNQGGRTGAVALGVVKIAVVVLCAAVTLGLLGGMVMMVGTTATSVSGSSPDAAILDKYDMFITNQISNALDGILSVDKVYWLSDSDLVAPKPKAENYGSVSTPGELMWLLEEASDLIGDQEMIFNENTPVWDKDVIRYYYDETILVITWKEVIDRVVYTLSEVKIAHPSQFRRFLAGGEFGSDKQYVTTDMAQSVNAVVASSGDFYKFRRNGAVVYEGQLRRFEGEVVDTCFINEDGDLLFAYRGEMKSEAEAEQFIRDNKVRFSLAFGPVLVDNGVACPPKRYALGEINEIYARAAVCQVDQLHYLLANAGGGMGYQNRHDIATFAKNLESFGVDKAYTLDGGQTTVIAMDGQLVNRVEFGYQRHISDIIYFATALPEGE